MEQSFELAQFSVSVIDILSCLHLQVTVSTLDVSSLGETQELICVAEKMAPVGGIFHLAMVLTDKWLLNQVSFSRQDAKSAVPQDCKFWF